MKDDLDDLLRVATAVADGDAVDWEGEDTTNGLLRRRLARLREIETIARLHRTPPGRTVTPGEESSPTQTIEPQRPGISIPPLPFTLWGHLEVGELIGAGGFGEVYRARDTRLQKTVALKLVRADRMSDARSTRRFLQEARRLARVNHENVLQVHGADVHHGRAGLWTDLIEGKTLEQILQDEGRRGWEEAALIGRTMCRALAAVHDRGLIHHDVKTGNIMRGEAGRYVLMDFSTTTDRVAPAPSRGSARAPRRPGKIAGPADIEAGLGTPGFMAPERFDGRDSGGASDVYSLGVVLYRLVTGRFPVEGRTIDELRDRHRRGESTPLRDRRPDLPDAFVQIVEQALDRDPALRFRSMGEMDRGLARALGKHDPSLLPEPRPFPSWAWVRYWIDSTPIRIIAVLAVAVVAGIYWLNLPTSLAVDARIYRSPAAIERFTAGTGEQLGSGDSVAPGDRLYLELRSDDPLHVYVLNHDEAGAAWLLFPLPDLDLQNPLPAGMRHRLPGTVAGREIFWVVSSAGGEERFVLIASRHPLHNFERQIAGIPAAGSAGATALSSRMITTLRGIGGLQEAPRPDDGDAWRPLAGIVDGIEERAAHDGGLWALEIRLRNPGVAGGRP